MYKYKMMVAVALTAGMMSVSVSADEATLKALEAQGVVLTESQASEIASISCEAGSKCTELVNKIADLVAANSEDDGAVAKILTAAAKAYPELAVDFGDAAMQVAPNAIATIAAVMIDVVPTAAGPEVVPTEGAPEAAPTVAIPSPIATPAFTPTPAPLSGGGSSSPS